MVDICGEIFYMQVEKEIQSKNWVKANEKNEVISLPGCIIWNGIIPCVYVLP